MSDSTWRITDIHSHVIPGVDDGAQDLAEAMDALKRLIDEGVGRVVATPHFRASLLERPNREADKLIRFDEAFARLSEAVRAAGLEIELERACEFKLDAPNADLSDPRLRLAGSRYALVELASFKLPPFAGNQLLAVRDAGWLPVLAHPERYAGVTNAWDQVEDWVREGVLLQVNARSLLGRYGPEPEEAARELLRSGWVSCLASDYHARGTPDLQPAIELLRRGQPIGSELDVEWIIETLLSRNPDRLLADEPVEPASALEVPPPERKRAGRGWLR